MLGKFQQSHLRIEVEASAETIRDSLLHPQQIRRWLLYQRFSPGMPDKLYPGLEFTTWIGAVAIGHRVQVAKENCLRLLLSQGIDGYHEWSWGENWVQSRLEGISLLPLNLGQTFTLLSLKNFVNEAKHSNSRQRNIR